MEHPMFDVVVIGAGLSGLQAAYSAQQAGLSVVVIEARDRVGGKTWSVPLASGRGVADLGAAWVNDKTQRRIGAYIRKLGLQTTKQRLEGRAVIQVAPGDRVEFPFGITPEFSPTEKNDLERIRDHIQAESLKQEPPRRADDQVSLDQYVRQLGACDKTIKMINLWVQVMHGLDSTEESAAFFIDYCRRNGGLFSIRADDESGGNHQRLHGGTQAIAQGIAQLIGHAHIQLAQPVVSLENSHDHVTVTTATGTTYIARRCILSIPSAMFRDLTISPPLPQAVRHVADSSRLGHYNKVLVCYDKPWWRSLGYNGFFMSYDGPVALARDTSVEETRHYALTCFVNGSHGERWARLPPHERRRVVLQQLAAIFNVDPVTSDVFKPIEVFDQIWKHEQYSKGALAPILALGHYTEFDAVYGKPVGNLHFVGTEYSREWKGYMEGALCSGEQGASEVIQALEQKPRARL